MGSSRRESERDDKEERHEVTITKPFYIGVYEVTQAEYVEVMTGLDNADNRYRHPIQDRGAGNEIQLTDAIARLISDEPVHVLPFEGVRYDCGSKLGYLQATVEYGLRHADLGDDFRAYLKDLDT